MVGDASTILIIFLTNLPLFEKQRLQTLLVSINYNHPH